MVTDSMPVGVKQSVTMGWGANPAISEQCRVNELKAEDPYLRIAERSAIEVASNYEVSM